jgi:hypothetical protein
MNTEYLVVLLRRSWAFIAVAYALIITFMYVARPVKVTPVTAVVTCDGEVVFSNDPNSSWQKPVFKDRVKGLLESLWLYERGDVKSYAARYAEFRHLLAPKSPAAKKASDLVVATIGPEKNGPIATESSKVDIDWASYEAKPIKGGWMVQVRATREIGVPNEPKKTTPYKVRLSIIEGEHDAVYQILGFDILDVQQ